MRLLRQFVFGGARQGAGTPARAGDLRSEDGSMLVEFAVVLVFFWLPMVIGVAALAPWVYDSIEIENAAHAGAEYGSYSAAYASDTNGIIAAAQADASDFGANLNVTPTIYWACATNQGGTQYSLQTAAASNCTGTNNGPLEFIQVNTSVGIPNPFDFKLPFTNIQFPSTLTISRTSVMPVNQ